MIVMVTNHTSWRTHYLQGKCGGLGLLLPPNGVRGPYPHLPYAVDNGAFPAWTKGEEWDETAFRAALDWSEQQPIAPRWVVVPDVVTQAEATIARWHEWEPELRARGFTLALAVQDGMTADDAAPLAPDVVFVGGTKAWKMKTIQHWSDNFPRVHVGRINGLNGLMACHEAGVESVDGTGFFRGNHTQLQMLIDYIEAFGDRANHPMFTPKEHNDQRLLFEV